ncbi:MAG: cytochrome c [SAR324 cluster bacterium]|nr:cytochrome c [SAR324 cluster bacterium]
MKLTAVSILLSIIFYGSLSFADSHGIIKYRQNVMKSTAGHMGAIVEILKNGLPLEAHVSDHARSMLQNSRMTLSMFPEGSGKGRTKSKQAIWENWSEFESAANDFERESAKLAEVAESGDMDALAKQVRATGKTCSGCHRNFRKRN